MSSLPAALPLWRADRLAAAAGGAPVRPTGFAALDAELPGGGWPGAGLIELLLETPGHGELRLLAPALAAMTAPLLWVAPPLQPYAPALAALSLAPGRLVIVDPERAADAAWAAEQALRAGVLAAVLWWQGREPVAAPTLRRLHLAATEARAPLFALRPTSVRSQSSPALMRLALEFQAPGRLVVDVFKRRGPPLAAPLVLDLPGPVRRRRAAPVLKEEPTDAVVRVAPASVAA
ncbi:MAG TPA: translesion DNA synthesis-associated protein ImuA [Burkholderiaceae bacterium]|nr:translesion DNA synthesis-associated protein ImuA [Burkholderiaceae bacterium]